jgi:hypothetical protein
VLFAIAALLGLHAVLLAVPVLPLRLSADSTLLISPDVCLISIDTPS